MSWLPSRYWLTWLPESELCRNLATEAELTRAFNPVPQPWASDVRGVLRAELQDLDRLAEQALARAGDAQTRIHLRDIRTEIARILDAEEE